MMHLVSGSTGEYSGRNDWRVKVFANKAAAEAFCKLLNDWCKAHDCYLADADDGFYSAGEKPTACEHDPGFNCDYTGTEYLVEEVEEG